MWRLTKMSIKRVEKRESDRPKSNLLTQQQIANRNVPYCVCSILATPTSLEMKLHPSEFTGI